MRISICSYSFHRLLASGRQDVFRYITDSKELGCTQLDPWNAHLAPLSAGDRAIQPGVSAADAGRLSAEEQRYLRDVRAAAQKAGLPMGCVAVDGAHIYEPTAEARVVNRARGYRWIEAAALLGASQVRIDSGGPGDPDDVMFNTIFDGYRDLIGRASVHGVEVVMENHWGPTTNPQHVSRILDNVRGLGLLFDTNNWNPWQQAQGWVTCAKYAKLTHMKTFGFDENGDEMTQNIGTAIRMLRRVGYNGCWGVESVPFDGDEYGAARKTIELIKRHAA